MNGLPHFDYEREEIMANEADQQNSADAADAYFAELPLRFTRAEALSCLDLCRLTVQMARMGNLHVDPATVSAMGKLCDALNGGKS